MTVSGILLRQLIETSAVSVRRPNEAMFWYAAGVPGAFYVNTEKVIGPSIASSLLKTFDDVLRIENSEAARSHAVKEAVLRTYKEESLYQTVVSQILKKLESQNGDCIISGGERRDWLFSIPVSYELGLPHLYLFKNGATFIEPDINVDKKRKCVHISDLIHNAASYTNKWIPLTKSFGTSITSTICVVARGTNGIKCLLQASIEATPLETIDLSFMDRAHDSGLIDTRAYNQVKTYLYSPKDWASQILLELGLQSFGIEQATAVNLERILSFLETDPLELRDGFRTLFSKAIESTKSRQRILSPS